MTAHGIVCTDHITSDQPKYRFSFQPIRLTRMNQIYLKFQLRLLKGQPPRPIKFPYFIFVLSPPIIITCFFPQLRFCQDLGGSASASASSEAVAVAVPRARQSQPLLKRDMDENMNQFQQRLIELETEAEHLLLARHELVENDKMRNGNREALTALRKRARTTKTSVPSPFESIMKDIGRPGTRSLVKELCATCGNHDSNEPTWMMFPGTDIFGNIPFHASHTILDTEQAQLDYEAKKLQSYVKEKSFLISEKGVLADKITPGVLRSLVTLTDNPNKE